MRHRPGIALADVVARGVVTPQVYTAVARERRELHLRSVECSEAMSRCREGIQGHNEANDRYESIFAVLGADVELP